MTPYSANFGKGNPKRKNVRHEDNEQMALIQWAQTNKVARNFLFFIPNGGDLRPEQLNKLKKMGMVNGVSDMFLAYPCHGKHGLWVEMKSTIDHRPRVSDEQQEWLTRMHTVGYATHVCYGWQNARLVIQDYLNGVD